MSHYYYPEKSKEELQQENWDLRKETIDLRGKIKLLETELQHEKIGFLSMKGAEREATLEADRLQREVYKLKNDLEKTRVALIKTREQARSAEIALDVIENKGELPFKNPVSRHLLISVGDKALIEKERDQLKTQLTNLLDQLLHWYTQYLEREDWWPLQEGVKDLLSENGYDLSEYEKAD